MYIETTLYVSHDKVDTWSEIIKSVQAANDSRAYFTTSVFKGRAWKQLSQETKALWPINI